MSLRRTVLVLSAGVFFGCEFGVAGELPEPADAGATFADGGRATDGGPTPDAGGTVDAGLAPDAGLDIDGGTAPDAGSAADGGSDAGRGLVHPGVLSTASDLAFMREMVDAGQAPWAGAYAALAGNPHSQASYVAHPHPTPCRGGWCVSHGYAEDYITMANDAAAAYQAALRFWVTGETTFADAAVRTMDGYATTVQYLTGDSNVLLMQGAQGFQWAAAAELLRDYQPWVRSGGFARFQTFLLERFYNDPAINNGLHRFLVAHNGTCDSHYWLNWDLFALAAVAAIGVVCDRRDIYEEAVTYYRSGPGNGAAQHAVWFMHPGYLGQHQEMGRDPGHASADPILLGQFLEVAWNQGDDLYSLGDNALLAMSEYTFKSMAGNPVPWVNYAGCDTTSTGVAFGSIYRPGVDLLLNHYVNRKGLAAPYTTPWAAAGRPENGGGAYGNTSGGFDQIGFTTLTHTQTPLSNPQPPSGLKADSRARGAVLLWWWGSAGATSYVIKRAVAPARAYSPVGTVSGDVTPLFTDTGLTPGQSYQYVVSAIVGGVETADSAPVLVTVGERLSGTVIGSSGAYTNGQGKEQLFDDAAVTFFDAPHATGDWAGLDLGAPFVITRVGYQPRASFAGRMVGGQVQASNVADFSSGVVTLATITAPPVEGRLTSVPLTASGAFRYVRYLGPANGFCNAAELQFEGHP